MINDHLNEHHYRYWCFINLYFHSGGRMTELLQQKKSTVDLTNQKYKSLVKKGRFYKEVERTIKDIAVPFWQEFLNECKGDEYLFGVDFKPAAKAMAKDTAGRWWKRIVKDELKINVDLYSLKHLNTDEITADLGAKDAARLNAHENEQMVLKVYAVGEEERQHQRLKKVGNKFA
jgi:integrase